MTATKPTYQITCGRFRVELGSRTRIMGILNITPDSFSDGGKYMELKQAVVHALQMEEEGADFIDVGGESSRPGAKPVPLEEELNRVIPVLEAIIPRLKIPVSIDTRKPEVAREAVKRGVSLINDIQGLSHPDMAEVIAETRIPVVIMHMQNSPETMQINPTYHSAVKDILKFFKKRIQQARSAGISSEQLILDPGIGFGKTVEHNLQILQSLDQFHSLNRPILIGTSNKSFIGKVLDLPVDGRLEGSLATAALASWMGAHLIRVHEVASTRKVIGMMDSIRNAGAA